MLMLLTTCLLACASPVTIPNLEPPTIVLDTWVTNPDGTNGLGSRLEGKSYTDPNYPQLSDELMQGMLDEVRALDPGVIDQWLAAGGSPDNIGWFVAEDAKAPNGSNDGRDILINTGKTDDTFLAVILLHEMKHIIQNPANPGNAGGGGSLSPCEHAALHCEDHQSYIDHRNEQTLAGFEGADVTLLDCDVIKANADAFDRYREACIANGLEPGESAPDCDFDQSGLIITCGPNF